MVSSQPQVLIVESTKLFRSLLADLMAKHGFISTLCSNGEEALKVCNETSFDMICIAYHLPDVSAETLCQGLRLNRNLNNTRIIIFTGEDNETLLKAALLAGATDIYNKNDLDQFQTYIQRFAESKRRTVVGKVLLIEDSPSQLAWMTTLLRSCGLNVDPFSDAESALQALVDYEYDVVVTDVVLTGKLTGLNQIRAIRRLQTGKGLIPIFALTAYDDASRRIELFHVGINDYMIKPVNPEELLNRVANLIELQVARRKLAQEQIVLQQMALMDPLTKLYNREAFNQLVPKAIAKAAQDNTPVSMALMDIDFFKQINDSYGHQRGDQVLQELGVWLPNIFRDGDLIFRWGGEEFVFLLSNCNFEQAEALLIKQCRRLGERKFANLLITASFGITSIADGQQAGVDLEKFIEVADQALYRAKNSGRNRVVAQRYSAL